MSVGPAAGADGVPISSARHAANWSMSLAATSVMTPRPNCAGRPVTLRSVTTCTLVEPPASVSCAVTVAPAVPLPRASLPEASMTARCAASSREANFASPL